MNWHDVEDLRVGKDQNFLADNVSSLALAGVIREECRYHGIDYSCPHL